MAAQQEEVAAQQEEVAAQQEEVAGGRRTEVPALVAVAQERQLEAQEQAGEEEATQRPVVGG